MSGDVTRRNTASGADEVRAGAGSASDSSYRGKKTAITSGIVTHGGLGVDIAKASIAHGHMKGVERREHTVRIHGKEWAESKVAARASAQAAAAGFVTGAVSADNPAETAARQGASSMSAPSDDAGDAAAQNAQRDFADGTASALDNPASRTALRRKRLKAADSNAIRTAGQPGEMGVYMKGGSGGRRHARRSVSDPSLRGATSNIKEPGSLKRTVKQKSKGKKSVFSGFGAGKTKASAATGKRGRFAMKRRPPIAQSARAARSGVTAGAKRGLSALGKALSASLKAAGPVLVAVMAALLLIMVVTVILTSIIASSQHNTAGLSAVEAEVAEYLFSRGYNDAQVAGIMGNIEAESGWDPAMDADDGFGTVSLGLFQLIGAERSAYLSWAGGQWTSVSKQMQWTFEEGHHGYWENMWGVRNSSYDAAAIGAGIPAAADLAVTTESFKKCSDVDSATFLWMAGYEGPAYSLSVNHLDRRLAAARGYYLKFTSPSFGSATGKAGVVELCKTMLGGTYVWGAEDPGGRRFDCSGLVKWAYREALGIELDHYSESQAASGEHIPVSQAEPGDILWKPGHVGIYAGNGQSIEAMGSAYGICYGDAYRYATAIRVV